MDCRAACLVAGRRVHGRHPFRGRAAVSSSGVVHKGEGRAAAAGKAAFLKGAPHPACGGASFSQGAWGKGSRGGGAATVAVLACQVVCLVVGHRAVGLRMLGCGDPSAYARRPGKGRPVLHYEGNPTQFLQKISTDKMNTPSTFRLPLGRSFPVPYPSPEKARGGKDGGFGERQRTARRPCPLGDTGALQATPAERGGPSFPQTDNEQGQKALREESACGHAGAATTPARCGMRGQAGGPAVAARRKVRSRAALGQRMRIRRKAVAG